MSKDYFDISKMAIDDETRSISKTEGRSGILGYGSEKTNTEAVAAGRG